MLGFFHEYQIGDRVSAPDAMTTAAFGVVIDVNLDGCALVSWNDGFADDQWWEPETLLPA